MRRTSLVSAGFGVFVLGVAACGWDQPVGPESTEAVSLSATPDGSGVSGGGTFSHPLLGLVKFEVSAVRAPNGTVQGRFFYHFSFAPAPGADPFDYQYKGEVTCFAVDLVNQRAWIGGVLTSSNDPDPNPIFHQGHDAWFRLLDQAESQGSPDEANPDRITFMGFEGSAGIQTSAEYCERRIWPGPPTDPPNARTWPVVAGNLTIR